MKKGKSVRLNGYKDFKVTYGTVDSKNLKSIYINIQSWAEPKQEYERVESIINNLSRSIKHNVLETIDKEIYDKKFIVDLDLRSSGVHLNKKSFMNLEFYLYTNEHTTFESHEILNSVRDVVDGVLRENLINNQYFNFYNSKTSKELTYI